MHVSDDLSRQEQIDLAVRARRCRQDLQPTSRMRDARDLLSIAEDDGAVVFEPENFQDLSDAGAVRRYQSEKTIRSHEVPPVGALRLRSLKQEGVRPREHGCRTWPSVWSTRTSSSALRGPDPGALITSPVGPTS